MRPKKILFIGLGGAGQRHLRIFKEMLGNDCQYTCFRSTRKTPLLNTDFSVNYSETLEQHYGLIAFDSLEAALDDGPDLAVISTPSALHFNAALMAAQKGVGVFIEKPFSNNLAGFDKFHETVVANKVPFFISYQRRHHDLICTAKKAISSSKLGDVFSAVFNVASNVPDWHAYEDYRDLYACRKDLGGGVLLTEIHELDLCHWFFGSPRTIFCSGGTLSGAPIDVEDTAHINLDYPGLSVNVNLCFMQRHNLRGFYLAGSKGYLEWNQSGNRLTIESYETGETQNLSQPDFGNEEMFIGQARHFLDHCSAADSLENLETARASLTMVEAAKQSMQTGSRVGVQTFA